MRTTFFALFAVLLSGCIAIPVHQPARIVYAPVSNVPPPYPQVPGGPQLDQTVRLPAPPVVYVPTPVYYQYWTPGWYYFYYRRR